MRHALAAGLCCLLVLASGPARAQGGPASPVIPEPAAAALLAGEAAPFDGLLLPPGRAGQLLDVEAERDAARASSTAWMWTAIAAGVLAASLGVAYAVERK